MIAVLVSQYVDKDDIAVLKVQHRDIAIAPPPVGSFVLLQNLQQHKCACLQSSIAKSCFLILCTMMSSVWTSCQTICLFAPGTTEKSPLHQLQQLPLAYSCLLPIAAFCLQAFMAHCPRLYFAHTQARVCMCFYASPVVPSTDCTAYISFLRLALLPCSQQEEQYLTLLDNKGLLSPPVKRGC